MIVFTIAALAAAGVSVFFWRKSAADLAALQAGVDTVDEARKYDEQISVKVYVRKVGYRKYEVSDSTKGPVGTGKTPRTAFKAWVDGRGDDYDFYTSRWLILGLRETA